MASSLSLPTPHPPQSAKSIAVHAPAVHQAVPPSKAAERVQRELDLPRRPITKSNKLKSEYSWKSKDPVIRQVDLLHFNVFKGPSLKAGEYYSLSIAEFVFGYLGNALQPGTSLRDQSAMLQHLRNLMHESTMYPWEGVRKFHGTVLRLMEQDRRLGLTKPWSMSYVPNTPVHQGPLPAIVAMLHSHAPAQSSRKGRVPTARTTSRPMAVRLLMSVDEASVSSGSTINMRRTVSPKRNGTKKPEETE